MKTTFVCKAIELLGGPSAAARLLSSRFPERKPISAATVCNWKRRGLPAEYCIPIEKELGGHVSRSDLRPDIYPPSEYARIAEH